MSGDFYSLCGHRCVCSEYHKESLRFPIEAYKKFCDLVDLPFPLEEIKPVCSESVKTKVQPVVSEKDDNEIEIIEGVTVGDMRKIFNRGAPIDEIVRVMIGHSRAPENDKTAEQFFKSLDNNAKRNGWGKGQENGRPTGKLSGPQREGVDLLFFPPTKGGRNKSKDYSI